MEKEKIEKSKKEKKEPEIIKEYEAIRKQGRTGVELLVELDHQNKNYLNRLKEINDQLQHTLKVCDSVECYHIGIAMVINTYLDNLFFGAIPTFCGMKVRENPYVPEDEIWIGRAEPPPMTKKIKVDK